MSLREGGAACGNERRAPEGPAADMQRACACGASEHMRLREALRCGEAYLARHGVADARVDARLLLEYVTGLTSAAYLARQGDEMPEGQLGRYLELLARRGSRVPLQHLTGEQEFMGLSFLVNEHVLIPRQDTETLAEEALGRLRPGMRVLDLCTGSGCIAVSLAKLGPEWMMRRAGRAAAPGSFGTETRSGKEAAPGSFETETRFGKETAPGSSGTETRSGEETAFGSSGTKDNAVPAVCVEASDISEEALETARENALRLGVQVRLIRSDLFEKIDGTYDMIVSNPPYIRTAVIGELDEEVRLHEPRQALDGHEDGLYFYRRIAAESGEHLVPGGWLLLEIGYDQAEAAVRLLADAGFEETRVIRDLAGHDRVVCARSAGPMISESWAGLWECEARNNPSGIF